MNQPHTLYTSEQHEPQPDDAYVLVVLDGSEDADWTDSDVAEALEAAGLPVRWVEATHRRQVT